MKTCAFNQKTPCPVNQPYCPIAMPGLRYCSYSGTHIDQEKEQDR